MQLDCFDFFFFLQISSLESLNHSFYNSFFSDELYLLVTGYILLIHHELVWLHCYMVFLMYSA